MSARDRTHGIGHRHDGQANREGDPEMSDAHLGKAGGKERCPANTKDEPERTNEFRDKFLHGKSLKVQEISNPASPRNRELSSMASGN
ncbi:hypothetical protein GCM10023174_05220 [Chelativorans composti]